MTDEEIRRLISLKSEGPNLDYKAGFKWSKENRDKKYELIRDLIALANSQTGGRIVFGVRDEDLEFVGVSDEIFESVDPTDVVHMLHENAAPNVRCAVFKREINGRKVVVFDVAEFDDTPIICTKGISAVDGSKRVILRQAAVYIRTGAGSTEEISSPDDMRSLLARAGARKSQANFSAHMTLEGVGTQYLHIKATQDVETLSVDYCLSDRTRIDSHEMAGPRGNFRLGLDGRDVRVPIDHERVRYIFWHGGGRPIPGAPNREVLPIILRVRLRVGDALEAVEINARVEHEIGSSEVRLVG